MPKQVNAELPDEPDQWLEEFMLNSSRSGSEIVRAALDYWRASSAPSLILLERQLEQRINTIDTAVDPVGQSFGWRSEVDKRLAAIEAKFQV